MAGYLSSCWTAAPSAREPVNNYNRWINSWEPIKSILLFIAPSWCEISHYCWIHTMTLFPSVRIVETIVEEI